jgi:hypothetical protein
VIIEDVIVVEVVAAHLVLIQDVVHLVHDLLVRQHHHVVPEVDQDHEVIIEKLLDVQITIIHNNQITMGKVEVLVQHVVVEVLEMVHVVVELNPMK